MLIHQTLQGKNFGTQVLIENCLFCRESYDLQPPSCLTVLQPCLPSCQAFKSHAHFQSLFACHFSNSDPSLPVPTVLACRHVSFPQACSSEAFSSSPPLLLSLPLTTLCKPDPMRAKIPAGFLIGLESIPVACHLEFLLKYITHGILLSCFLCSSHFDEDIRY